MARVFSVARGFLILVALSAGITTEAPAQLTAAHPPSATRSVIAADLTPNLGFEGAAPLRSRSASDRVPAPVAARAPAALVGSPNGSAGAAPPVSIVVGSTQQALINQDRAANGLAPLTWSSCLYSVARSNAARMAAQGFISHTNGPTADLACHLGYSAGENVGYWSGGISDAQLNSMFMASAGHRANILGAYHHVATAWVVAPNGFAYIAVEFS
jgi:uncharacterized protein YkwD